MRRRTRLAVHLVAVAWACALPAIGQAAVRNEVPAALPGPSAGEAAIHASDGAAVALLALQRAGIDRGYVRGLVEREHIRAAGTDRPSDAVMRGRPLPPHQPGQPPPERLVAALPAVEGHVWRQVGRDLVLVSDDSEVVFEVLPDVLR